MHVFFTIGFLIGTLQHLIYLLHEWTYNKKEKADAWRVIELKDNLHAAKRISTKGEEIEKF